MPATRKKARRLKPLARRAEDAPSRPAAGDSLNAYIREIAKFRPLSGDEEKELARRVQAGDEDALQRLVEANLRFVVSYCKRYRGLGLSFLDLIHEGSLGLMEAARRFDPDRGVKFISYAVWWVRQAIFQALSEQHRIFRLPQKLSGQVSKVGSARSTLARELDRAPTTAELAQKTDLTEHEVENALKVTGDDVSLSTAVGDDGTLELGDVIEQDSVPSVERELMRTSFEEQIRRIVSELDEKERQVISMRFGLDGEDPMTLQEIGEAMKLSRERIRQIESKAKEKLRRNQRASSLRGALN
jgi:RNA polymerase primary sigma factor